MATKKAAIHKAFDSFQSKIDGFQEIGDVPTLIDFLREGKCVKSRGGKYVLDCGAAEGGSNDPKDAQNATGGINRQYVVRLGKNRIFTNPFSKTPKPENSVVSFVHVKDKPVILQDGDAESGLNILDLDTGVHPTISYQCLARLMGTATKPVARKTVVDALASGRIKVLAFSPDTYLNKKPKNATGFTQRGTHWHRSATVLFRYKNESWMVGQDEDTYFGVVLADHPTTLNEAFISLQHPRVRGVKGVLRQGEWFISPVKDSDVPESDYLSITTGMTLPKEVDGNSHELYCATDSINKGEIRIKGDRVFVKIFRLTHPQHKEIVIYRGWHEILKNTAVRSVSVEGVD